MLKLFYIGIARILNSMIHLWFHNIHMAVVKKRL